MVWSRSSTPARAACSPTPRQPLIGLAFNQQRYEADYRFRGAPARDAEGVALYRGENESWATSASASPALIRQLVGNHAKQKQLNFFTVS